MVYLKEKYYKHLLSKLSKESKSKFVTKLRFSCRLLTISKHNNDGIYVRSICQETIGFFEKKT